MANPNNNNGLYAVLAIVAVVAVVAFFALRQPHDSAGSRLGNAIDEMSDGLEDAGRELDPGRGPVERLGESIEDAGEEIQERGE